MTACPQRLHSCLHRSGPTQHAVRPGAASSVQARAHPASLAKAGEAMRESMVRVLKARSMPVTSASPSPAVPGLRPSSEVWGVQASASPGRLVADPAGAQHMSAVEPCAGGQYFHCGALSRHASMPPCLSRRCAQHPRRRPGKSLCQQSSDVSTEALPQHWGCQMLPASAVTLPCCCC